ncbi:helix-turn-helix domain-containing protein [Moraxella sp. ZJ142]|uniref:helix-turn-helix domain-containing protein n=1 Tax=Moraxella marmotae TaxID=3344520 RepID=UPI0035D4B844
MTKRTDNQLSRAIGRAIAAKRQAVGLTQAQVAESIGVSDDAISKMERGGIMPTIKRLSEFAMLFDCETTDFLTDANPTINDEARHVMNLLAQLEPSDRAELIAIIERLVAWKSQG